MSELIQVTRTPVQITDGTAGAHITLDAGAFEYADSANSPAWHRHTANLPINVTAPTIFYLRTSVDSGAVLSVVVTRITE
ncbi:hypothetical protein [Pantoea sp. BAV 3049]|uniref:hypothetical protein n=1 Tax=Pantoea sp. BAV 3049 TaxID=2654188 RepID=UPI00131CB90E|nr:hypothetical protein [Pantoea sp. BAV 3049]